ncbi:cytochrome c biogenesis heme-transporting ATPase CcmA [Salinisphaera aquimarina]|uniref:Cytochrome c biogenesis heme-transporting ATPase CcmA n=1 Tax=Salinisphaera aquimarina TaxID=2094031 RepID=A0ABV7EUY0_9GAMM
MASPRLIIDNLSCGRGERALFRGLSLILEAGEAARVLGDNGSGKTTLLRTLCGLHAPFDGDVQWQGSAPAAADEDEPILQDDLCFVGHDNALNGALTPIENLDVLMRLSGRRRSQKHIRETLTSLGLKPVANRACERLSAGQRRRVSLARLWLTDAPLWLLDEPASALDVDARAVLGARIAEHVGAGGLVLFTTHEPLTLPDLPVRAIELTAC